MVPGDLFKIDYFKYIQSFDLDKRFEFVKKINKKDYNNLYILETLAKYWIEGQKNIRIDGDFQFLKTHHSWVKLNNYPDGGVARLRIYGTMQT